MKKALTIIAIVSLLSSCVSKREAISSASSSVNYTVKETASAKVASGRLWILFIPIGLGPRKYEDRKEKVTHRFLKQNKADAILNGEIVDRKIVIPLILVSYSTHWTKITGKPCIAKTDSTATK